MLTFAKAQSLQHNVQVELVDRASSLAGLAQRPAMSSAGGPLVAIVVFTDPWHDLGLFTFNAAWVFLGPHLIARARQAAAPIQPQQAGVPRRSTDRSRRPM